MKKKAKQNVIAKIDIGDIVICDSCSEDYTDSQEQGGFLFLSRGICPKCAVETYRQIKKFKETGYIRSVCPTGMSFKDFILGIRNGDNKIIIKSIE